MPIANAANRYHASVLGALAIILVATIAFSGGFQRVKAAGGPQAPLEKQAALPRA